MAGYYDYSELREKAINGDQLWGYRLYPIIEGADKDECELEGWELR